MAQDDQKPIASVIVPMVPAPVLNPNGDRRSRHWSARATATAELRKAAKYAAVDAWTRPGGWTRTLPLAHGPVRLRCVIAWGKGRREQDTLNASASLKALVDGLQDAGWFFNDKQVIGMDVIQERDTEGQGSVSVEMFRAD